MPAYVISEVKIVDEENALRYRQYAYESIEKFGGKYIVRGAKPEFPEGKSDDFVVVIIEFPSIEIARNWYESPQYAKALKYRDQALNRHLMIVDGVNLF